MSDVKENRSIGSKIGLTIKRIFFIALPLFVIVGGIVGFVAMGALKPVPEEKAETVEALSVLVATAVSESVALSIQTQGEVKPRSEVALAAQISGRVTYVSPSLLPGSQFRRGATLVRIEPREFELRVVQAEANVAQAQTALIREISEADIAAIDSEELGLENVSDLTLRRPQLAEAQARLASAEASLDEAKLQLSRTVISAPFTGRVREKSVDVGAYISPGMKLGQVYSSAVVDIPIPLTDNDLATLGLGIGYSETANAPGPEVKLSAVIAGEMHEWTGRIIRTDSGYDPDTRVLFAYVEVKDPYGAGADDGVPLATGLFVTANIAGKEIAETIVLPRTALRGTSTVYVVRDDDTLEIRPVTVAFSDRQRVVITSGLAAGEQVISSPIKGAANGITVNPVDRLDVSDPDEDDEAESDDTATAQLTNGED